MNSDSISHVQFMVYRMNSVDIATLVHLQRLWTSNYPSAHNSPSAGARAG
jgi:hypothetical protein